MSLNFMAAVSICSDFGAPQNKVSHLGMGCVNFFFVVAIHLWTGSGCLPELRHFSQGVGFPEEVHYVWAVFYQ